jgi:hypothetical protein
MPGHTPHVAAPEHDEVVLATPAHLNVNKISREVRAARARAQPSLRKPKPPASRVPRSCGAPT